MNSNLSTKLSIAVASACFLGAFAAAALAGPAPQFFQRTATSAKADSPAALACPSCKTTDIYVATQHGPAGKGTTEWTTVGKKHECAMCSGAIDSDKAGTADTMVRDALKCGTKPCCVATTK